jgi:hypothetical protein
MAQNYSPRIVQDSLVMCLDASQNKSYPTTDLPVKDGLVMWMDAADDTTFSYSSGTTVSQWRDKSGFNYHMVPVSAGPTRNSSLASRKVLTFTTSQQIWNSSINLVTSAYTIFCVTRLTGTTNARVLSTQYVPSTGGNWLLGHWSGYVNQYYAEGWVSGPYGTAANTAWNVFMGDWSGSSTDLANLYTNGTAITTNSNGANSGPIGLGVNINSEVSTCESAEIVVFNRVLSATERRLVDTYLGQKWGILNADRNIFDLSGYEDNGFLGDGTTANMPLLDYYNKGSLRFDGSNDYLSVTRTLSVPLTISGFIKYVDQSKALNTFINGRPHNTLAISLNRNGSGNLQVFIGNGSAWLGTPSINASITLSVDTWYHITFTCDGLISTLYVNGVSVGTSANIPSGFGSYFYLGHLTDNASNSEFLKGNIAAAQLYTTALSAAQVLQNYEAQKSKFAISLVQQGLILNLDSGNPYSYAGAGTTWFDTSGNSYNSTLTNGPTYSNDNGGVIAFDGVDDYSVSSVASITDSSTLGLWIKAASYAGNKIPISIDGTNYGSGPNLYFTNNVITWNIGDSANNPFSNSSYPDSNWHYIVVTNDSSTNAKLYIDGVLIGTALYRSTLSSGSNNFWIARFHGDNNYTINARMGSIQLYNRVLTAAEVLQNYNATKGRFGL